MTREEAIAYGNDYYIDLISACCKIDEKHKEFVRMSLKALEQEPRKGHWIANAPQYDMLNPQYICSECGNAHTRTTPYCEMCGAKMVEPQEREGT